MNYLPYQLVSRSSSVNSLLVLGSVTSTSRPTNHLGPARCASRNVDVSTVRSWNSSNASSSNTSGVRKNPRTKNPCLFGSSGMSTTLPQTNSSPLKIGRALKGHNRIPSIHFQVQKRQFQRGYTFLNGLFEKYIVLVRVCKALGV